MSGSKQTINCHWCEKQVVVPDIVVERQYSKYGGFFCTADCKSEYVYAEFQYIMSQPATNEA